jgi:hypothetical protein
MPPPPDSLVATVTGIEIVGLAIISLIGLLVLKRLWTAGREPPAATMSREASHAAT